MLKANEKPPRERRPTPCPRVHAPRSPYRVALRNGCRTAVPRPRRRYDEGTTVGKAIAIAILVIDVLVFVCLLFCLVRCIRKGCVTSDPMRCPFAPSPRIPHLA